MCRLRHTLICATLSSVSGISEMTSEEIVLLASSLRNCGVSRFSKGDLTIEFAPVFIDGTAAQDEPVEQTPIEKAALMLAGRGRAA